ncbi:unnamed protein product [Owenia fusiformis]|uniref:Uncharacterized protein n=1 Tax=Owenia fusiformis TaxID=6347 RepID=A0A8J1TSZ6_OWEFU|nr:unnamed protein product [Owenia fusiformis]
MEEAEVGVSPSNKELVEELVDDYGTYLTIDASQEKQRFEESIEDLLTRLDEYCGLVDLIRSDSTLNLTKTLPEIYAKSAEMQLVFERIDQLETFVAMVSENVSKMEVQVNKAESEHGSMSSIKKIFSNISFPFSKKPVTKPKTEPKLQFNRPTIFRTEQFFPVTDEVSDASAAVASSEGTVISEEPNIGASLDNSDANITKTCESVNRIEEAEEAANNASDNANLETVEAKGDETPSDKAETPSETSATQSSKA